MARRSGTPRARTDHLDRARLIDAAARIMAEEGVRDFQLAKRKASQRLSLPEGRDWPGNAEIERAFEAYLALFHPELGRTRRQLREQALALMARLSAFDPRLVGAVLSGWVTRFSVVELHVAAPTPEEFDLWLRAEGFAFEQTSRRFRFGGERVVEAPVFRLAVDAGSGIAEVSLFDPRTMREAPLSPIDGRPMPRAHHKDVAALMARET